MSAKIIQHPKATKPAPAKKPKPKAKTTSKSAPLKTYEVVTILTEGEYVMKYRVRRATPPNLKAASISGLIATQTFNAKPPAPNPQWSDYTPGTISTANVVAVYEVEDPT